MLPLNRSSATPASRLGSAASFSLLAAFSVASYGACASSTTSGGVTNDGGGTTSSSGGTSSGTGTSSGGGTSSGTSSGLDTTTSSSSGTTSSSSSSSSSSGTTLTCPAPAPYSGTLPFAVDSAFVASGYEGDYGLIVQAADKTCGGSRATGTPVGICHTFTYNYGGDAGQGMGWAGVVWQSPPNNWGAGVGFAIPAGATKVTFWAKGMTGMEKLSFNAGGMGSPGPTTPCVDTATATLSASTPPPIQLSTTWTQYTMTVTGTYAGGVLNGFSWVAASADQPAGGGSVTFYLDGIEWSM